MLGPELRTILDIARRARVTQIEIAYGDLQLRVKRRSERPDLADGRDFDRPEPPPAGGEEPRLVRSPMVGFFHAGARPGEPPCVDAGDTIAAGAKVGCVETMGTLTDIIAPIGGVVDRYLTADGSPVEYGQPVLRFSPSGWSEEPESAE